MHDVGLEEILQEFSVGGLKWTAIIQIDGSCLDRGCHSLPILDLEKMSLALWFLFAFWLEFSVLWINDQDLLFDR